MSALTLAMLSQMAWDLDKAYTLLYEARTAADALQAVTIQAEEKLVNAMESFNGSAVPFGSKVAVLQEEYWDRLALSKVVFYQVARPGEDES